MKEVDTRNLINAHKKTRNHLISLLEGVNQEIWTKYPENSNWSIQSTIVEILNYEIKLINEVSNNDLRLIPENLSFKNYKTELKRISNLLFSLLKEERKQYGFLWQNDKFKKPSCHWIMVRTIQHSIYHCGGLSVLRSMFNLPRANYENWPEMVDSVFEAILVKVK